MKITTGKNKSKLMTSQVPNAHSTKICVKLCLRIKNIEREKYNYRYKIINTRV